MNPPASVFGLARGLVHPTTSESLGTQESLGAQDRHAVFVAKRLAFSFAALAGVPFVLAYRGAPNLAETIAFACSLTPLAAALVAARTGRLSIAHAIVVLGLSGLGLTAWLGLGCGAVCATTWLLAAHVEARAASNRLVSRIAGATTVTLLTGIAMVPEVHLAPSQDTATALIVAGLAVVYCWLVSADWWPAQDAASHEIVPQAPTGDDEMPVWRAIAETMDDPILVLDLAGTVERVRIAPDSPFALQATELMGRGLFERLPIAEKPPLLNLLAAALRDDAPAASDIGLRLTDGAVRRFAIRARRVAGGSGQIVATLRATDAQAQPFQVEATPLAAEEPARSNDHFIASMSHELRTPLNAIIGFSEMLASHTLRPAETAKQLEYARIINQSGQHLLSVVNAILDMSKINSGTFAIVAESFEIAPLVDLCCDMVALKAKEGRVAIARDHTADVEPLVGDKRACQQILINLLSNAVKFTPAGGQVVVAIRPDARGVALSVSDTGIGIEPRDLAKLGDPFFQADPSLSHAFEGTGLGLSVVRGLVGLHGGRIAIESAPGLGTQVTVRLPYDCRARTGDAVPAAIETSIRRARSAASMKSEHPPNFSEQRMMQVA